MKMYEYKIAATLWNNDIEKLKQEIADRVISICRSSDATTAADGSEIKTYVFSLVEPIKKEVHGVICREIEVTI